MILISGEIRSNRLVLFVLSRIGQVENFEKNKIFGERGNS